PKSYSKYYLLRILNWLVPICVVAIGLFITTQKFAPMMNYDERVIGKPLIVLSNGYRIYNPGFLLLGIFKYASDKTYSHFFFEAFPPTGISLIIAFSLYFITALILNSHQKIQNVYGTARWGNKKDLKETGHLQRYGVVCGQLENADVYSKLNPDPEKANIVLHMRKNLLGKEKIAPLICHSGALNTWMFAPTGSAKGVGTIIPTCLNYGVPYWAKVSIWEKYIKKIKKETVRNFLTYISPKKKVIKGRRSFVCFDPKGENYAASAGYRSKFSVVIPFRPLDEEGNTAHYNPISEIPENPKTAFAWADMIAEIFFGQQKAGQDATSEYFANKARDIFTALVLHVRFAPEDKIPWKEKNMSTVLSFMSEASNDGKAGDEGSTDEENEGCGEAMLAEMIATDHGYPEINDLIRKAANRSKIQPAKERGSTYSTIFSKISLFQDPLIAEATAYSDFSVDDFINGKHPISLYLIVPYNHIARIAPVFRMLITFMIKKFSDGTTNANEVKLKIPCLFLLDEFPVLGYFPDIAQNMGVLRGYGVTFFIVSQSKQQMAEIYGENHAFFGHCKTKIVYAPNEPKDAKEISEIIGTRSVLLDNKSTNTGNLGASNLSSQEISVSLMNADELMKLEYSRNIILLEGKATYRGKKVVYYEDPRFKNKAFMELPKFAYMQKMWKRLPSNRIVRKAVTKTPKEIVEGIDIQNAISSDFDVFAS
ncbi:MAG: type IV secretory system conjugative DNA transfer family protein, partial [Spirochaetaceae bacterium]|nr:type IV secretory system conjugative DNA transfer family protein [Spirochaetaceae bacterium]